jgi:hypothetical protein
MAQSNSGRAKLFRKRDRLPQREWPLLFTRPFNMKVNKIELGSVFTDFRHTPTYPYSGIGRVNRFTARRNSIASAVRPPCFEVSLWRPWRLSSVQPAMAVRHHRSLAGLPVLLARARHRRARCMGNSALCTGLFVIPAPYPSPGSDYLIGNNCLVRIHCDVRLILCRLSARWQKPRRYLSLVID